MRSHAGRWALVVVAVLFGLRQIVSGWRFGASQDLGVNGDIGIYIAAINYLKSGGELYDFPIDGSRYGFTYPPFAAIVLRPLTWLDPLTTGRVWLTLCALTAVVIVVLVVSSRRWPVSVTGRLIALGLAVGAFLGSVQVQLDLISGQVNLILGLLVLIDVARWLPERFRGVLVGLAAAIKLTPMIIWAWYALTRQWATLARSVGMFVACGVLAWAVMPSATVRFFTDAVFQTERVGDAELRFNNSVMGVLSRLGVEGQLKVVLWLGIGGVLVLAAFWHAQRARRAGDHVASAILLGLAAVVATPVAWPHHQIWLPLAGIVLVLREHWVPRLVGVAVVAYAYLHTPIITFSDAHGLGALFNNVDVVMIFGLCLLGLVPSAGAFNPVRSGPYPRPGSQHNRETS